MSQRASPPDPAALTRTMAGIADECQRFLNAYWASHLTRASGNPDPLGVLPALQALMLQWVANPTSMMRAQQALWQQYLALWQHFQQRLLGEVPAPVAEPAPGDRRFRDAEWRENPFFDFVKQSYLIAASTLFRLAEETPGMDAKTAQKAAFYVRQFADAFAPSNFVTTNPEVLRATLDSGGRNLIDGLRHLLEDFDPAAGRVKPRMVDGSGFELGRNIATTSGKVVFQNELMQLLQYAPATPTVKRRPLLIIPPWINKFYILDLQAKNSFIRWATARGHTVFVISWVNPGPELRDRDFEDYVFSGPLAALDAIRDATGEREVNVIGYCIGGTLLGATLAYLRARGDTRVASATFFTALLDFSDVGDLGVFIDDAQIAHIEREMDTRGYLDGQEMSTAFNLIRANDLIWSFVVNNYLLGRDPAAFDLLYWNSDSTRMPARMHSTYLRRMYRDNALREPGGITLRGVPVDLAKIDLPACFVSAVEDHIAPWKTTFVGAGLLRGDVTFLLGKAGHVAGIINPPGPKAYGHYTGPQVGTLTADEWFAQATPHAGSWWETWAAWVERFAGGEVPAREPGGGKLKALEDAPGSYVRKRDPV
ncbi:MAG: PHA/PHB synthase family protein [Gammaproteobacteria bacterium]